MSLLLQVLDLGASKRGSTLICYFIFITLLSFLLEKAPLAYFALLGSHYRSPSFRKNAEALLS